MNKISQPVVDDAAVIEALSNNKLLASYPTLKVALIEIKNAYVTYKSVNGNVLHMPKSFGASRAIDEVLKGHYRSPPKDLEYIKSIRNSHDNRTCPMCGSSHSGSLDHVLPQSAYGIFSVFSLNLVPACKCNFKRGNVVSGSGVGQRVLHPYFDSCLADRVLKARFENLGPLPEVTVEPTVPTSHPDYHAIVFHLKSIVEKNGVQKWLRDRWIAFCREPRLVVRDLKHSPKNLADLILILQQEIDLLDDLHGSKNNWHSIFVAGLLEKSVYDWIFAQMHAVERPEGGPLV